MVYRGRLADGLGRLLHANLSERLSTECNIVSEFNYTLLWCLSQHQMDRCIDLISGRQCLIDLRPSVRQGVVVSQHILTASWLALIANSYQLMIAGSLIQSVSLFTLSLVKPGQFYLVRSLQPHQRVA